VAVGAPPGACPLGEDQVQGKGIEVGDHDLPEGAGNLVTHRRYAYLFQASLVFEGKEAAMTIPAVDHKARLKEQDVGAKQGGGAVSQTFGDNGKIARSEDDGAPIALQTDGATVHQEQLVLIDMLVEGHCALAQKHAQDQVIDLG
jgi:hypothetical protein